MGEIIYSIYYENKIFHCVGDSVKPFFRKGKYYLVTNRGSRIAPLITYHTDINKNEELIGDLGDFIKILVNAKEETFILRGFGRAFSTEIFVVANDIKKQRQLKEKKENIQNKISDKDYKVKDFYETNNLVVAKFECRSEVSNIFCFNTKTTEQKYIFEVIEDEKKKRYREVFTGFIVKEDSHNNLPYIVDVQSFVDYFPEMKGAEISKLGLIWAQNDINFNKRKKSIKLKKRKK